MAIKATTGTGKLYINGQQVGAQHLAPFGGFTSSINETFDLGRDSGSAVSSDYESPDVFNGRVTRVTVNLN